MGFDVGTSSSKAVLVASDGTMLGSETCEYPVSRTPDGFVSMVITGLRPHHTRRHMYRAVLEGTALAVRHNIELIEQSGLRIERIAGADGGLRANLWPQIVTDVTGRVQTRRKHHQRGVAR
nr:FGGY-family carbohydrate kinase [Corynebacterium pseudogenitalium]